MTYRTRSRRGAFVAGALTTALLVPLLGMSPALAAGETPLTSFVFTDGNTTGREQTYDGGTDVSFVLNGETSGAYEFTGCVAVMTNGDYPGTEFATTLVTTFIWTAGTNLETLLPGLIDLSPATEKTYYIDVFFDINQIAGATCHSIWAGTGEGTLYGQIGDATLTMGAYVAPATPPLTSIQVTDGGTEPSDEATFAAGSSVTVVLNDATTGDFSFTGCWLVVVNNDFSTATGPSTSAPTTWTAGTPVDTLFPSIDLTPDESTQYEVFVWTFAGQEAGIDCRADEENFTIATILMDIEVASDPETPAMASFAFTDGTVDGTGDEQTYAPGTDVRIVINDATTGTFEYTGCVAVQEYDDVNGWTAPVFTTTSPTTFTWTAGTNLETLLPGLIDLDAASSTEYYIELFYDINGIKDATCQEIWDGGEETDTAYDGTAYGYLTIEAAPDPESMTLTGTPKLGDKVTVAAKVPGSLIGNDFDLWACPDQTIYPDDLAGEDANGDCYGPIIQNRSGDSTEFVLGYDPERDGTSAEEKADAEAAWAEFCDKFFIVHDYPGGSHSNWLGPIDCTVTPELAETGASDTATAISIGALAAMLLGGMLLVIRRNRAVSIR